MADWFADVQKYDPNADPGIVSGIVRHCGIALQKRDSSLVSFSSADELKRVRESFLKKKLGRTEADDELDDAIAAVGQIMKGDRTKNRVTVYYLLARNFGQLHLFDRLPPAAANASDNSLVAGAGGVATAAALGAIEQERLNEAASTAGAPEPSRIYGGRTLGETTPRAAAGAELSTGNAVNGGSRWWLWAALLAVALVLLFLLLRTCGHQASSPVTQQSATAPSGGPQATINSPAATTASGNAAATSLAAPDAGAGVVAETQNGLPALKVYFDVGKSAVTADAAAASKPLRDYVQAHPTAHVGISGYNDPTGNPALNAALSKSRAENVAAALEKAGLPASAVILEKPANATSASTGADSRRVEVVIRP